MSLRATWVCLFLALLVSAPVEAQTADYYVATNGNDTWSGTLPAPNSSNTDGPFATIGRAQQAVRAILSNPNGRTTPITVMVRQGTYWQSQALQFSSADSGSSQLQVIWENYPDETPIISGGQRVTGWNNVSGNEWQVSLAANTQYFEQLFYNNQRRLRPRLGSSSGNDVGTYFRILNTIYLSGSPPPAAAPDPNCSVYVSGSGWECFDRFQYNSSDPISASWKNLAPPAGNPCNQAPGNSNLVGDIEVIDFEVWTVSRLRVSCIDTANQIIYMTGQTQGTNQVYGLFTNHRYLVENVQDELQQPGQWFLDRSGTPWVLTYLSNPGENPNTDWVVIPQASQVLVASQLQYVTFEGIWFENDNFVVPAAGYPSVHGDFNISAAVSCQNCQYVTFNGDVVTQTSGNGLEFITCLSTTLPPYWCVNTPTTGTTANNTIENSAFFDIGAGGIRVGSIPNYNDTDSSVPQFTTVQNNVIEGVGRTFPSTFGISQGSGHDNVYTHNDIYDGYHSGISICGFGGCLPGNTNSRGTFDITISFNHVYNLMQGILNDNGAVYMNTGSATYIAPGNKILNNRVHDVTDASVMDAGAYGGYGLELDGTTGMVTIQNNMVYRTTDRPMAQTCGPQLQNSANIIQNNVFSFTARQLEGVVCGAPPGGVSQFSLTNNLLFFSGSQIQVGCAYCSGTNCLPSVQKYYANIYCDISTPSCTLSATPFRTTNSSCKVLQQLSWSGWQGLGEDLSSKVTNPLFVNPFYPADNFALQSGSPASQVGFVPFDVNAPGRTSQNLNPPAIAATFPTGSFVATATLTLASSNQQATYGQTVDLTASATSAYGPPPDGTQVTFYDSGTSLGTASTSQGSATLPVTGLSVGGHTITASFSATAFWPATTSGNFWQGVQKASSTSAVTSNLNPSAYGQAVTLTATVTSSGGTPTGTVSFEAGTTWLGSGTLNAGVATLTTSKIPVGTSGLVVRYSGDSNFLTSTSPSLNQTVNQAVSTTTVTSTPNPSNKGQKVTFTATVTSKTTTPTGSVAFMSGTETIGSRNLKNGVATLETSALTVGTHSITAVYNGNSDVLGSTSKALTQTVK